MSNGFSTTNYLYIPKGTIFSRSSTGIERINHCRKCTKGIGAWSFYFSDDIDFYGTDIGDGNTCIYLSITTFSYMYFPCHGKNDVSLVIHLLGSATFSSAPYLYQEFISCVDDIALRSRYIDSRSKGDFRILEEIIAKYSALFRNHDRIFCFSSCTAKYFLLRGGRLVT